MKKNIGQEKKRISAKKKIFRNGVAAIIGLAAVAGIAFFLPFLGKDEVPKAEMKNQETEEAPVEIPAIELIEESIYGMTISLFVYNGKVYMLSATRIGLQEGKALLGEKVGTTKGNLDEWSEEREFNEEFASTIGEQDVFTVKGYRSDFRLMTYNTADGALFYEQLNGITVATGEDVFGKLKMAGNVVGAEYQTFSEADRNANQYRKVDDKDAVNQFVENLNETKPFRRSTSTLPLNDNTKNDEGFRDVIVHLKDGSSVRLFVLKHGFVYYDGLYFKMEEEQLMDFWKKLDKQNR